MSFLVALRTMSVSSRAQSRTASQEPSLSFVIVRNEAISPVILTVGRIQDPLLFERSENYSPLSSLSFDSEVSLIAQTRRAKAKISLVIHATFGSPSIYSGLITKVVQKLPLRVKSPVSIQRSFLRKKQNSPAPFVTYAKRCWVKQLFLRKSFGPSLAVFCKPRKGSELETRKSEFKTSCQDDNLT